MARNKFDVDEKLEINFNFDHVKRLLRYLKPYKNNVTAVVIIMILSSIAVLIGPYLIKDAIDYKIPNENTEGLLVLSAIFLFAILINAICLKLRIKLIMNTAQNIIHDLRKDLFTHLQKLTFSYYDSRPHGKILIRVVNYVNSINNLLANGLMNIINDIFNLVFIVIFMLIINVKLTLLCMAAFPILAVAVFALKNVQRKKWQQVSRKRSNLNAYVHESICGIKVTQSFVREHKNLEIFRNVNNSYRSSWISAVKVQLLTWPVVEIVAVIGASLVYVVGINWIGKGITIGTLVAFLAYLWRFWMPIINMSNYYNQIIITSAYLERIFETMDEKPAVEDAQNAYELPDVKGNVIFDNIRFGYEEGREILHGINHKVKAGETIALVGPTGAGKTTIVNLISRFYDISNGHIFIDGHDISKVTLSSLRKQMGIMMQDTFIFSGTIMDNIRYGNLDADDKEVMEAAKAVKAHDFIKELNDGYYTKVNERGSRLSTGQRQLISFARALLADPRILILDEATSSVDSETEIAIQQGLAKLLKGRTSFIIAHRLSTIKNATRILYIDDGIIAEKGTHDELMKMEGKYYRLYMSQYKMLKAM